MKGPCCLLMTFTFTVFNLHECQAQHSCMLHTKQYTHRLSELTAEFHGPILAIYGQEGLYDNDCIGLETVV